VINSCTFVILGKFHTLARSGGFSQRLAAYELSELDECRRARQQQEMSISDEELMQQLQNYEREVKTCNVFVYVVMTDPLVSRCGPVTVTCPPWAVFTGIG